MGWRDRAECEWDGTPHHTTLTPHPTTRLLPLHPNHRPSRDYTMNHDFQPNNHPDGDLMYMNVSYYTHLLHKELGWKPSAERMAAALGLYPPVADYPHGRNGRRVVILQGGARGGWDMGRGEFAWQGNQARRFEPEPASRVDC